MRRPPVDGVLADVLHQLSAADSDLADPLREARADVAELVEAVRERIALSRVGRHSTGPFADSDTRIDAALARVGGSP